MLGASIGLLAEAGGDSSAETAIGAALGVVFVHSVRMLLERVGEPDVSQLSGADAAKALLIIAVMTAHSTAEGVGVGAAFGDTGSFGLVKIGRASCRERGETVGGVVTGNTSRCK